MAKIGLEYFVAAPLNETPGAPPVYTGGMVIAVALKADLSVEFAEAKLYGDNILTEYVREFKSGKLTLGLDEIRDKSRALLLGQEVITDESGTEVVYRADDRGSYVGVGFMAKSILKGNTSYRALWIQKVLFSVPGETYESKGDNLTFQTPSIEGEIAATSYGTWKRDKRYTTRAAAKAWLDELAGIEEVS
jgi:phi13 family phage major tail protein